MNDFAKDVQTYLGTLDLIDGQTSWPSTVGVSHDDTDRFVIIHPEPGRAEVPAAAGAGSAALEWPAVHIRVRAHADERDEALAKALAIRAALHGLQGTDVGDTTVIIMRAVGQPVFVVDERQRPSFAAAYVATVAAVAAA